MLCLLNHTLWLDACTCAEFVANNNIDWTIDWTAKSKAIVKAMAKPMSKTKPPFPYSPHGHMILFLVFVQQAAWCVCVDPVILYHSFIALHLTWNFFQIPSGNIVIFSKSCWGWVVCCPVLHQWIPLSNWQYWVCKVGDASWGLVNTTTNRSIQNNTTGDAITHLWIQ